MGVWPVHMSMNYEHAWRPQRSEKGFKYPGTEGIKLNPLYEQVLLIDKSSLQVFAILYIIELSRIFVTILKFLKCLDNFHF